MIGLSTWGLLLLPLLLVPPILLLAYVGAKQLKVLAVSLGRYLISLAIAAEFSYLVYSAHSIAFSVLSVVLLSVFSTLCIIRYSRIRRSVLFFPILAGNLLSTLAITFFVDFVVIQADTMTRIDLLMPTAASLVGLSTMLLVRAVKTYHSGLRHHTRLYYYMLGNGATHAEALRHFERRAVMAVFTPVFRSLSYNLILICPMAFWIAQILGAGWFKAFGLDVVLVVAVMAHASVSLVITLYISRHYAFDEYERLKDNSAEH